MDTTVAFRLLCLLFAAIVTGSRTLGAQFDQPFAAGSAPEEVEASADELEFLSEQGLLRGSGSVRVQYGTAVVEADELRLNTETNELEANGNITVHDGDLLWKGESVRGNLRSRQFAFSDFRSTFPPWHFRGAGIRREESGTYTGENLRFSTCEYLLNGKPHWHMRSKRIIYSPTGEFKAYHVVYRIGQLPVFYAPVIWGSTKERFRNVQLTAGYKGGSGIILGIGRQWQIGPTTQTQTDLIFRGRRGIALNTDTDVTTSHSTTNAKLYGMHDLEPPDDLRLNNRTYNGRFETAADRFRVEMRHRHDWLAERLALRVNVDHFSDHELLREFFRRDFRTDPQPTSIADLQYTTRFGELALHYRPRLNPFESVVERLPELRITVPRTPVKHSDLLYYGESSYARLRMNWREYDLPRAGVPTPIEPSDYASDRFDTVNFLYYPTNIGAVRVTPRMGARFTHYSRSSARPLSAAQLREYFRLDDPGSAVTDTGSAANYDDDGGERSRVATELGLELSWRYSGIWGESTADGGSAGTLRHQVQPYVNYTFIPQPTEQNTHLYFFDAVDRVQKAQIARVGAQQKVQTWRDDRFVDVVTLRNYFDFHVETPSDDHLPGDFGTMVDITPNDTLSLRSSMLIDTNHGTVDLVKVGATLKRTRLETGLGYMYREDALTQYSYSMGSELEQMLGPGYLPVQFSDNHNLHCHFAIPLGDISALRIQYFWDMERGSMGRQVYEFSRDLHCWVGALRFEEDAGDFSLFLMFYLKAFPGFRLDLGG